MQKILFLTALLFSSISLIAQRGKEGSRTISTAPIAVNEYTTLSSNALIGASLLQVSNSGLNNNNRFSNTLEPGDLLLIIQMQGAQIIAGNVPEFGTITDYNGAGNYEWAEVKSVPNSNQIELMCGLLNAYQAAGKTQVVRIPRYKSISVSGFGGIIAPQWDGSIGGVVALEIDSSATLNAVNSIDVSGKGFRGGTDPTPNDAWWGVWDYSTSSNSNYGAQKGEGIAGWLAEYDALGGRLCRGAAANGGGGGNAHNAGGGGGANAGNTANYTGYGNPNISNSNYITAWNLESPGFANSTSSGGGKGGYSHTSGSINALTTPPGTSSGSDDDRRNVGGLGGKPLDYSQNRAFMGGGGGGGEGGSNESGDGSNGGGIILIRSFGSISGSGTLKANGANGIGSTGNLISGGNDGSGGGGGGGAIIIQASVGVSGISIEAKGGDGGTQQLPFTSSETQGPGGGGGGGYVALPNVLASVNVAGGNNGTTNSNSMSEFPPNGATKGGSGLVVTNLPTTENLLALNDTLCNGGTASLLVLSNPAYTYAWGSSPDNFNLGTGLTFEPVVAQTTTFYLNSCNLNQTIEVKAILVEAPLLDAGENLTICEGQEVILNATAQGSYFWDANPALSSVSLLSQSIVPETSGYLYLNASFDPTCTSRDSILISVLPEIPLELTTPSPSICAGQSLQINAISDVAVVWSSAFSFVETNFNTLQLDPLNSGTIYASVSAAGFCEAIDSLSFIVNALPIVDAGSESTICAGTSAQLQGSSNASFAWLQNPTLSDPTVLNPLASPDENTWYFLQSTTAEGCSSMDSVWIQVGGSAPISAGNDTSICAGSEVLLAASGGNTYAWSNGQLLNDSTLANPVATLSETTSFVLTGSIDGSCIARDTVTINVFLPTIPILSGGGMACNGQPAELSISGVQSVQWEPADGLLNPNALITSANPSSNTNYIANYIDVNGCQGISESITVTTGSNPINGFSWNQISNFEVVFESNATGSQTSTWIVNDTTLEGDSVVYNFPYETIWEVMHIVSNACGSDTSTISIEVIKQVGYEDLISAGYSVYPNPAHGQIAIRRADGNNETYTLHIFNAAGQLMHSINKSNSPVIFLDVSNWVPGVYEFVFNDSKHIKHLRFIR